MKKHFLLLAILLGTGLMAFSQITFQRDTTYQSATVYSGQTLELNVYGLNTTGTTKTFVWTVQNISTPTAWVTALCTFPGNCFNITVGYRDSFELSADSSVLIRVDYTTNNACGSGIVKILVAPSDDPLNKKALYFVGNGWCTYIADQKESDALIQVFPNPSTESISITSPIKNASVAVYNASGAIVDEFKLNSSRYTYDINHFTSGNYILVITDKDAEKSYVKEFIKY